MDIEVINQVIILFFIILIGVYAKKRGYISNVVNNGLTKLLLNITLPLLVLSSFMLPYSKEMLVNAGSVFLFGAVINIVLIVVGKVIYFRLPEKKQSILRFITLFSNSGFMGYPILEGLLGKTGVFYGSVFNIDFNLFMFTIGIMFFTGTKNLKEVKKLIINPVILSILIGFTIFIFSLPFPKPLASTINMVGSMTSPLSMIIIGVMLADVTIKEAFKGWEVYYGSFIRLIAAPLLTILILRLFNVPYLIVKILVIIEAMPAAANTAVMSEQYNGDNAFASRCIFISTLFSIITIPLALHFL